MVKFPEIKCAFFLTLPLCGMKLWKTVLKMVEEMSTLGVAVKTVEDFKEVDESNSADRALLEG